MRISEHLKEEFCIMDIKSKTKEDAIIEVVSLFKTSGKVTNIKAFADDILKRESLSSTGIGYGLAIPHSRTESVNGFVIGFGRSDTGIDFKSLDGEKVNLIFLMGANPTEINLYLRLLAELSKLLMNSAFRKELLSASTPSAVIEIFRKFENGK